MTWRGHTRKAPGETREAAVPHRGRCPPFSRGRTWLYARRAAGSGASPGAGAGMGRGGRSAGGSAGPRPSSSADRARRAAATTAMPGIAAPPLRPSFLPSRQALHGKRFPGTAGCPRGWGLPAALPTALPAALPALPPPGTGGCLRLSPRPFPVTELGVEWPGLERNLKDHPAPTPAMGRGEYH